MRGQNFKDPYFSSYNIIGNRITELIPGFIDPAACESLCQLVDSCTHWTLDIDDEGCYLVDSPEALEYSDDKISGPRSCDIKLVSRFDSARTFFHSLGCPWKHAIKRVSGQENINVAIIINVVQMPNASLTATLLNLVFVQQDFSISITIVWISMNAN